MRALSTLLMCTLAAGCGTVPQIEPKPKVQIPRTCEELAKDVDGPDWHVGDNAKALLADTTVALEEAKGNLKATRECQAHQREAFANEKLGAPPTWRKPHD
jgi:hypothetical protein